MILRSETEIEHNGTDVSHRNVIQVVETRSPGSMVNDREMLFYTSQTTVIVTTAKNKRK